MIVMIYVATVQCKMYMLHESDHGDRCGVASFYRILCYHFMFSERSAKQLNQCLESFVKKFIGINTIITN